MKRVRKEGNNNIYAFAVHTRNLLKLHYRPYNTACVDYACRAIVEREISIILLRMVGSGEEETRMHYIRHHISTTISIIIIIVVIINVPMKKKYSDDVAVQESQVKRTFGLVKPFAFAPRIHKNKFTDMHQS